MKTSYKVLMITFVINLFMAFSLNSFTSPTLYLPMMFLYFLSGLAAFLDKIAFYKSIKQKPEEYISWICFSICFLGVCFYTANSLGFIEVNFQRNNGTYKVLMQGVQNSFFTFNSINVTPAIFIPAYILPFAYPALCLVSYLREQGLTMEKVINISRTHKKTLILPFILSIIIGVFIGVGFCYLKYNMNNHIYGHPQYHKYFLLLFIVSLCASYVCFFLHYKNDNSGQQPEEESAQTK